MATEKQLAAKSTGPCTPEGKARSACNARSHGFTGSTFAVVRLEDLQEVAHLRTDLIAVYRPVNSQELFALERMALMQQTILRAARLESGLFINCLDLALNDNGTAIAPVSRELVGDGDIEITRAQNRNYALADGFDRMARQPANTWSLFLRYQAQAERHYRRAVEEFDRLKRLRPELPNEAILEVPPEENKPACAPPDEPISPNPEPRWGSAMRCPVSQVALPSRARKQAVPPMAPCVHEAQARRLPGPTARSNQSKRHACQEAGHGGSAMCQCQ
jgi:hypothetical protein